MVALSALPKSEIESAEPSVQALVELTSALNDRWTNLALTAKQHLSGSDIDFLTGATDAAETERQLGEICKGQEAEQQTLVSQIAEAERALVKMAERANAAEALAKPVMPDEKDLAGPFERQTCQREYEAEMKAYREAKAGLPRQKEQVEVLTAAIVRLKREQFDRENEIAGRRVEWLVKIGETRSEDLSRVLLERHAITMALANTDARLAAFALSAATANIVERAGDHLNKEHGAEARRRIAEEIAKVESTAATALFQVSRDVRAMAQSVSDAVATCERHKTQVGELLAGINAAECKRLIESGNALNELPLPPAPPKELKTQAHDLLVQKQSCERELKDIVERIGLLSNEIAAEPATMRADVAKAWPEAEASLALLNNASAAAHARAAELRILLQLASAATTHPKFAQMLQSCIEGQGSRLGKTLAELADVASTTVDMANDARKLSDNHPARKFLAAREGLKPKLDALTQLRAGYNAMIEKIERAPRRIAKTVVAWSGIAALACAVPVINLVAAVFWIEAILRHRRELTATHPLYAAARTEVVKTLRSASLFSLTGTLISAGFTTAWPELWPLPLTYGVVALLTAGTLLFLRPSRVQEPAALSKP